MKEVTVICKNCSSLCDWEAVEKTEPQIQKSTRDIYTAQGKFIRKRETETIFSFTWICPVCTYPNRVTTKREYKFS